jgi:hypothetical protein
MIPNPDLRRSLLYVEWYMVSPYSIPSDRLYVDQLLPYSMLSVEVRLSPHQRMQTPQIRSIIESYIHDNFERLEVGVEVEGWEDVDVLRSCAERIVVAECCKSLSWESEERMLIVIDRISLCGGLPVVVRCEAGYSYIPTLGAIDATRIRSYYWGYVSYSLYVFTYDTNRLTSVLYVDR